MVISSVRDHDIHIYRLEYYANKREQMHLQRQTTKFYGYTVDVYMFMRKWYQESMILVLTIRTRILGV